MDFKYTLIFVIFSVTVVYAFNYSVNTLIFVIFSKNGTCNIFMIIISETGAYSSNSSVDVGTGVWSEWDAWTCAKLSGSCYMVRHRHCSAHDDSCPEYSYSISACDNTTCGICMYYMCFSKHTCQ